ncbi:MAG TPA: class I SAM-dependent methyltransferase [Gillisia sp.]|nr:class I SAM-dependent methyltransferase [Gillisia sp.]
MLLPEFYVDPIAEKNRYEEHNNDVNDPRYQNFVSPITTAVLADFPATATGLDYGCGTGPVAAVQLQKQGYTVKLFDPFFENHPQNLEQQYDFIICCEVMEHFFYPYEEFKLLAGLLKPGGKLYCKTSIYNDDRDFDSWYYKNDPTHVFLYSPESLEWIKDNLKFSKLQVQPKLIVFEK